MSKTRQRNRHFDTCVLQQTTQGCIFSRFRCFSLIITLNFFNNYLEYVHCELNINTDLSIQTIHDYLKRTVAVKLELPLPSAVLHTELGHRSGKRPVAVVPYQYSAINSLRTRVINSRHVS